MINPIHIGDGAYVHVSAFGDLIVTANHHHPTEATDTVGIEIQDIPNLVMYLKSNFPKQFEEGSK